MSHLTRVQFALKVHRIGWYATRQSILRNGGSLHDVAWVLASVLTIQGA